MVDREVRRTAVGDAGGVEGGGGGEQGGDSGCAGVGVGNAGELTTPGNDSIFKAWKPLSLPIKAENKEKTMPLFAFGATCSLVQAEFDQMDSYLDLIELSIQQNVDQLERAYQEAMSNAQDEEEASWAEDYYVDEFQKAGHAFPQFLLLNFVVSWYSCIEVGLLDLCKTLELTVPIGIADKQPPSKGVERAKYFLKKARNYAIDNRHWEKLTKIRYLRNHIVHRGKNIPCRLEPDGGGTLIPVEPKDIKGKEELYKYMQKHNIIEITGIMWEINPTVAYCRELVAFGRALFSKLEADLK
jgi:hypothetical protein